MTVEHSESDSHHHEYDPRKDPKAPFQNAHNPVMFATEKEMMDANLPIFARDYCAHFLIPLNKCRRKNLWLPWKCHAEKEKYEECQYLDFVRRAFLKMEELKKAKAETTE